MENEEAPERRQRKRSIIRDELKLCTACEVFKPFDQFNKNANGLNGLLAHCRECDKAKYGEGKKRNVYRARLARRAVIENLRAAGVELPANPANPAKPVRKKPGLMARVHARAEALAAKAPKKRKTNDPG